MLRYEDVHKRYGDHHALRGVSFEVPAGSVFGLLGPNGAGKTSLIRLALDLVRPDAGRVRLFGAPPSPESLDRLSYLPEERGLYRSVPVLDVLTYLGELKGLPRAEARRRALASLDEVGLADVAKKPVSALSKGMSQKVQLVAALFTEPELAILDEPFSGLDPVNARVVVERIEARRAKGLTTLLATHQLDRAETLCDELVVLHRGRVVLAGAPAALLSARGRAHGELEALFVATVESEEHAA